jgi:hypothetical protein
MTISWKLKGGSTESSVWADCVALSDETSADGLPLIQHAAPFGNNNMNFGPLAKGVTTQASAGHKLSFGVQIDQTKL